MLHGRPAKFSRPCDAESAGFWWQDTASAAVIQIDGNDTLTLSGATINGGTAQEAAWREVCGLL